MAEASRSPGWFLYSEKCPRGGVQSNLGTVPLSSLVKDQWLIIDLVDGRIAGRLMENVIESEGTRTAQIMVLDVDKINYPLDTPFTYKWKITDAIYARIFDPKATPVNWSEEQFRLAVAKNIDRYLRQRQNMTAKNKTIEAWLIDSNLLPEDIAPPRDGTPETDDRRRRRAKYLRGIYRQWSHMFTSTGGIVRHSLRPEWEIEHRRIEIDADLQVSRGMASDDSRIRINWWMLAQGLMMIIRSFSCFQLVDDGRTPALPSDMTLEEKMRGRARVRRDN